MRQEGMGCIDFFGETGRSARTGWPRIEAGFLGLLTQHKQKTRSVCFVPYLPPHHLLSGAAVVGVSKLNDAVSFWAWDKSFSGGRVRSLFLSFSLHGAYL
jgi:hypothetical protein